jgi:hypothetical protein
MNYMVGNAGSSIIAWIAYRLRSLSLSGCLAAVVIGTIMYAMGGPVWYGTLSAFFVSSSLLSQWNKLLVLIAAIGFASGFGGALVDSLFSQRSLEASRVAKWS